MPTHGPPSPILQKSVKRQRQDSYDGTSSRNDFPGPERLAGDANLGGGVITGNGSSSGRSEAGASAAHPAIPVTSGNDTGNGNGTGPGPDSGSGAGAIDVATTDTTATANTADSDGVAPAGKPGQSSNFRNVSACNRCRLRKNRCDQKLPSCASCNKVGVSCVGYDPITKKEIPRSYVFYLETRVEMLEKLLVSNNIPFPPAEDLDVCSRPGTDGSLSAVRERGYSGQSDAADSRISRPHSHRSQAPDNALVPGKKQGDQSPAMLNIVSPAKPRSLASASGVSFARVVFAAVQYSVSDQNGGPDKTVASKHSNPTGGGTSMRDSFFGLHTRPTIQPATFPSRDVAMRLVTLYFEHANPQIPILHRGEFMRMFEKAYANEGRGLSARELYMLNMVFAIGCGVIVGEPVKAQAPGGSRLAFQQTRGQCQPEEYHASAIVHLEECLSSSGGGLEVLQAVLLLANFALLRPVPPGLWYITGVAVRLAVDLGLHHEDGVDMDDSGQQHTNGGGADRGRRLWIRDMRRRLWWCTYSFDRLVSTCVGRPFGISDQVITTEFPSLLDDAYITPNGFTEPPAGQDQPSYKRVAHHYFRLRMLQSEILQVLQYNQAQITRSTGAQAGSSIPEWSRQLPSPYLVRFDSYRSWRVDIERRLREWKDCAPSKHETGVAFSTEFLDLNYWQAIVLLYKQSLSIPAMFEGEYNPSNEVNSPTAFTAELREDEERIYLKVAEAGQKILRIYRQLHLSSLVSYTYLSTHHLFTAGISYLYAIWHSPAVRSRLTMDEVDFTVLAAKSVFTDMIDKCPPAETCRDAFDRTARATIQMATSQGGFGSPVQQIRRPPTARETTNWAPTPVDMDSKKPAPRHTHSHHHHRHPSEQQQQQQQFHFDLAMGDSLSSPSLSTAGDRATPPATMVHSHPHSHGQPSPMRRTGSYDDGNSTVDQSMITSPSLARSQTTPGSTSGGNPFLGQRNQQFGMQGHMEYPDAQTMELLQTFGTGSHTGFGGMDQSHMDFGLGMSWESMHNDYAEAQPMNPFDTFFFGGPQGGNAGFGAPHGASGHSGDNDL
ncbi:N-terminal binuclear Zn cluster-containing protein [Trichoderma aethiopicum]